MNGKKDKMRNSAKKQPKQNFLSRFINDWFDRVVGAMKDGGLSEAQAKYAPHKTTRDFVWNSIGNASWAFVFPVITMISTWLVGVETAGIISMAFVVGILLMFVGNFGVRTYQISDINSEHSFKDYQANRWVTCLIMLAIGWIYCTIRGYDSLMFNIFMGVIAYKFVDALADVYEGRLQQEDKLYLAGISQAIRSLLALAVFFVVLLIFRNPIYACYAMAASAAITFVAITWPLTLMETPKSKPFSFRSFTQLFKLCFPLFLAIFLFNVIDNMPKFMMEGVLSYDFQLYFNALYFPSQMILIIAQIVYKPLLLRMAGVWQESKGRGKFNLILFGILLFIVVVTGLFCLVMMWVGIDVLCILYDGVDFNSMKGLVYLMLVTGGLVAAIDYLYQVITIMRKQKDVTVLYLITFGFSLFVPPLLIHYAELEGAVLSYVIIESILFVLLVWEYFRIRRSLHGKDVIDGKVVSSGAYSSGAQGNSLTQSQIGSRANGPRTSFIELLDPAEAGVDDDESLEAVSEIDNEPKKLRPSEIRAERERREEIIRRRTHKDD